MAATVWRTARVELRVTAGQRDTAAQLVEDRIEALARQVTVLRRLHDSVRTPDAVTSVPASCSGAM